MQPSLSACLQDARGGAGAHCVGLVGWGRVAHSRLQRSDLPYLSRPRGLPGVRLMWMDTRGLWAGVCGLVSAGVTGAVEGGEGGAGEMGAGQMLTGRPSRPRGGQGQLRRHPHA